MAPRKRPKSKPNKANKRQRCETSVPNDHANGDPKESTQTTSLPFLPMLPRELRDHIYHIIWSQKTPFLLEFERGELQFKLTYDNAEEPKNYSARPRGIEYWADEESEEEDEEILDAEPKPTWLLANRQILTEAMAQFHRKLTWSYVGRAEYEPGILPKIHAKESLPCYLVPTITQLSEFLPWPWDAHTLFVPNINLHMQIQLKGMLAGAENLWTTESPQLKWLKACLASSPRTKRLVFHFNASTGPVCQHSPTTVDLRPLTDFRLSTVRSVEVVVHFQDRKNNIDFIEANLRQKLSDAVSGLLGWGSEVSFEAIGVRWIPHVVWNLQASKVGHY